jgi:hypothetical protein
VSWQRPARRAQFGERCGHRALSRFARPIAPTIHDAMRLVCGAQREPCGKIRMKIAGNEDRDLSPIPRISSLD